MTTLRQRSAGPPPEAPLGREPGTAARPFHFDLPAWPEARGLYLGLLLLALISFAWPLYLWGDVYSYRENGPVEGPQSIYLFLATLIFLWTARLPGPLTRLEMCGIALFCFNLFIRESDPRGSWAEHYVGGLFAYGRAFYFLAGLWINVVAMTLLRFRQTVLDLFGWLRSPAGLALLIGCLFYVVADRAEKHWIFHDPDGSEMLEETLELFGCFCFFVSACLTAAVARVAAPRSALP